MSNPSEKSNEKSPDINEGNKKVFNLTYKEATEIGDVPIGEVKTRAQAARLIGKYTRDRLGYTVIFHPQELVEIDGAFYLPEED